MILDQAGGCNFLSYKRVLRLKRSGDRVIFMLARDSPWLITPAGLGLFSVRSSGLSLDVFFQRGYVLTDGQLGQKGDFSGTGKLPLSATAINSPSCFRCMKMF